MGSVLTVREIGEQGLLQRLQRFCPPQVIGDDAALLTVAAEQSLVVTTDTLVDGVHFSDRTTSPIDAGWRATAANLSDLAAMGATPLGITVGLALPGETAVAWVEQFYQGITHCLAHYETPLVGGDICRSPVKMVAITAFGQVPAERAVRRSTAEPGDAIVVTGVHGASRAGLELLLHPQQGQSLSPSERAALIQAHQRPRPRLDVLPLLKDCPRVAGMDSSDGLADAVLQICRASRTGAQLDRDQIPFPAYLTQWISQEQAIDWALYGGEDFELVLCLPQSAAQTLVQQLGPGAAIVGMITPASNVVLHDRSGTHADEILSLDKGFQHFAES
ncbi:MAG: thiamine-phosphate kinase [Synechococcales cyanobacterium C42_A2020_086]|nr:thiamine-phosphate kinase [Synechococcales cyanobacterium C42_A2020_086]